MKKTGNFLRYEQLRKKYPVFIYESFYWTLTEDQLEIVFRFSLGDEFIFTPTLRVPINKEYFVPKDKISFAAIDNLAFHIGMIEQVSYWKASCSPVIIVRPYNLTGSQVSWWKNLYFNGLGEFFHTNGVINSPYDFVEIRSEGKGTIVPFSFDHGSSFIIPSGGGKDSAVTMELLGKTDKNWHPFAINPGDSIRDSILAAGKNKSETIVFIREIHPQLLELNDKGFLNGHTPFSAVVAFHSLLAAYLTGLVNIALSNESSANEATIPDTAINHQYSKTYAFEKDFREYVKRFISPDFNYFSFLRPLTELQIARLFSRMPHYFKAFRSCNVGSKTGSWCGVCAKCLFTFIILSPFIKKNELIAIFGKDLFSDFSLIPLLDQLTGQSPEKPFECVGTINEVNLAMVAAVKHSEDPGLPPLLRYFHSSGLFRHYSEISPGDHLVHLNEPHFVPGPLIELLEKSIQ